MSHSDYLINGAEVVLLLLETMPSNLRTIPSQILPAKLEQVKPRTSLKPDQ